MDSFRFTENLTYRAEKEGWYAVAGFSANLFKMSVRQKGRGCQAVAGNSKTCKPYFSCLYI